MKMSRIDIRRAEKAMRATRKEVPHAMSARFDPRGARIVVSLSNGLDIGVPVTLAQGISGAKPADLNDIVITPTGLGLHWPRLDADLYLPALLEGVFGTRKWMAQSMGKIGGRSTSTAKKEAARANGKLGGRPRKSALSAGVVATRSKRR